MSASHVLWVCLSFSALAWFCSLAFTTLLVVSFFYHSCDILHLWLDIWTLDELASLRNNNSLAASFHLCLVKLHLFRVPFLIVHLLCDFLAACELELTLVVMMAVAAADAVLRVCIIDL